MRQASADSKWRVSRTLHTMREKTIAIRREGQLTLLLYLISIRMFPATPNWLLNILLPHCSVPLDLFFLSMLLGLMPYNLITVNAGSMLASVESLSDIVSGKMLAQLSLSAILVAGLAPALRSLQRHYGVKVA